jgi:hypothetical protein
MLCLYVTYSQDKTFEKIRNKYYWKGMFKDVSYVNHNKQNIPVFFKVCTIYGKTTLVLIFSSEILHTGIKVRLHMYMDRGN